MSKIEAARYILNVWIDRDRGADDFNAAALMVQLVMLGVPVSRADVLLVARAYCDSQSENRSIGKKLKRF